jgi:integrase
MHNGITYRVSLDYKPTNKEAQLIISEKISADDPSGDRRDTFAKSAEKYLQIKSNVLSPSTIRGYNTIIRSISTRFMNTKTCDITQELIQKEINDYSASHSPKSTRNLHGFISAVLTVYKPSLRISTTLPQKRKYESYTPSEDDVKRILNDASGTKYEIPFRLGCYGMRRGEICAITDADLNENLLHIDKSKVLTEDGTWIIKPFPKTTESERTIYIDDELADLIRKQGYAYKEHPERLSKALKRIQKRLKMPEFRFHDLRAYYASMAHAMGVPDAYIMANGGWSSTNILNRVYKRTFTDKQIEMNQQIADHLRPRA